MTVYDQVDYIEIEPALGYSHITIANTYIFFYPEKHAQFFSVYVLVFEF